MTATSSKKLVVFGAADVAQIAARYFNADTDYEVMAYTVDAEYIDESEIDGVPVVAFESVTESHPPSEHDMFVALSYTKMNRVREAKVGEARAKGYTLPSYISPHATYLSQFPPGENCFIFEDNTVQPFVRIGDNVTLWSGNHIGHHSVIKDHNFISSHVVVSGHCVIEPHCFLGVNSTLGHQVTVAEDTLLGAGVVISKDTEAGGVYVPPRPTKLDRPSSAFSL